ncbi:MAG: NADP-dependent oxidoreductase [Deltaproteobacteria bacterium]|jgi:NADPH-dependent curcumin reductase CurA|nr:NADP-dependent oxidoreductase [Deltaproteobacteria bacterium]
MTFTNGQWRLRKRPEGMVQESDFEYVEEPVRELEEGEVLVRNLYLAFEPAMRGWIEDAPSYMPHVEIGAAMRASTIGQVIESKDPAHPKGQLVSGMLGWQQYVVAPGALGPLGRLNPVPQGLPPTRMLSLLGTTGLTAYFGTHEVQPVHEGNAVLVSGAAGATGSVVAQIARIQGAAKVVGIAGGPGKCRWLREQAKLDEAIDYKSEDVGARLGAAFPNGIDLFFDNVGGEILDAALLHMANHGRITMCGAISGYNEKELPAGPRNIRQIVTRRLTVRGFILLDHLANAARAIEDLSRWSAEGRIVVEEDIQEGFENTPKTFLRLFQGKNLGKQLLKIAEAE